MEGTQRELPFPLIFSHVMIGIHHSRLIHWAFKISVMVTILLVPIVLLLAVQWMFLPYHSGWITFNHQLVLTLDLLLLWIFWPLLSSPSGRWWIWWPWSWRRYLFGERLSFVRPRSRRQRRHMWCILISTIPLLVGVWTLLVPPGKGIERLIGYQPWPDRIRRTLVLREQTLMQKEPPAELLFEARGDAEAEKWVWEEAGEALDLRKRNLRYADFSNSKLWDADLRGADLQHAKLQGTRLQGANLRWAQLQGTDLREAAVYGTQFQDAELSLADLRGLRSLPVGWSCRSEPETPLCELECKTDWGTISRIEALEAKLEEAGEHWPQYARERVEQAIKRFWSVAFDLSLDDEPLKPTVISPLQGFEVMHDWRGLFAAWPAPPDVAEFEQARAKYRAELACDDRYIAKGIQQQTTFDSRLKQALKTKAESGECPARAEVLKEDQ